MPINKQTRGAGRADGTDNTLNNVINDYAYKD